MTRAFPHRRRPGPPGGCTAAFLAVLAWLVLTAGSAAAVAFVDREAFLADDIPYRDYPYRLLFKMFGESRGAEKRSIRNVILLRMAFEETPRDADPSAVSPQPRFGIIRGVDGDTLRLWDVREDRTHEFHVGIDRIPLINPRGHAVDAAGIDRFASVVYELDGRVYRVEVLFGLRPPGNVRLLRQEGTNRVLWDPPPTDPKPSAYRVFVNGERVATSTNPEVEIPLSPGRADAYSVASVYRFQEALWVSRPSEPLLDTETAEVLAAAAAAEEGFRRVRSAVAEKDWKRLRGLLEANRELFDRHLGPERKAGGETLSEFFAAVAEADRMAEQGAGDDARLAAAEEAYRSAAEAAAGLPQELDVSVVADERIRRVEQQRRALAATRERQRQERIRQEREDRAQQIYREAAALRSPEDWPRADERIAENRRLLEGHLPEKQLRHLETLSEFFAAVAEADRLAERTPVQDEDLAQAAEAYRSAARAAADLPPELDVSAIAVERTRRMERRRQEIAAARERQRQQDLRQARERKAWRLYREAAALHSPEQWPQAEAMLAENRALLIAHLPPERFRQLETLSAFFTAVAEADRAAEDGTGDEARLAAAADAYRSAAEAAAGLPPELDVSKIADERIQQVERQRRALAATRERQRQARIRQEREDKAQQIYREAAALRSPEDWPRAEAMLAENRALLREHLPPERLRQLETLSAFFTAVAEADRAAEDGTGDEARLAAAADAYRSAAEAAAGLPPELDVSKIADERIQQVERQRRALAATRERQRQARIRQEREDKAQQVYREAAALRSPEDWPRVETRIAENRELLKEHLPEDAFSHLETLSEFFAAVVEADRLAERTPVQDEDLTKAAEVYRSAARAAAGLPPELDVSDVAEERLRRVVARRQAIDDERARQTAEDVYGQLTTHLDPSQWRQEQRTLQENRALLDMHLDPQRRRHIETLAAFFGEIEAADRIAEEGSGGEARLAEAAQAYRKALRHAESLPAEFNVSAIATARAEALDQRRRALEENRMRQTADDLYNRIAAHLTPSTWREAAAALEQKRGFLKEHLSPQRYRHMEILSEVFAEIEAGDRLVRTGPEGESRLVLAESRYRRAGQIADALPEGFAAAAVADSRLVDLKPLRRELEDRRNRAIAREIYRGIVGELTPQAWERARIRLEETHDQIAPHLSPPVREQVAALLQFFRHLEVGDRLLLTTPWSEALAEAATASFQRAGREAEGLKDVADLGFVVKEKIDAAKRRKSVLEEQRRQVEAASVYRRVMESADARRWSSALQEVRDRKALLESHLPEEKRQSVESLATALEAMEAAEAILAGGPEDTASIQGAEDHYRRALSAAEPLSGETDLAGFVRTRLEAAEAMRHRVEEEARRKAAAAEYRNLVSALTPKGWKRAQRVLTERGDTLAAFLPEEEKAVLERVERLAAVLNDLRHILGREPSGRQDLDEAAARLSEAETVIDGLAPLADLSFLVQEPREEIERRKAIVERDRKRRLADKTLAEMESLLNPEGWEEARETALRHLRLLLPYLGDEAQADARLLVDFFRDIEEADRERQGHAGDPDALTRAEALYREAEDKAIALSSRWDLLFVTRMGMEQLQAERDAARAEAKPAPPPAPMRVPRDDRKKPPAFAAGSYEPKTALRMAVKRFESRRYAEALELFRGVYDRQIAQLRQGGRKQAFGILGISPEFRAEVLFLVEVERLGGDGGRRGRIQALRDAVSRGTGAWSIVSEADKGRIRRHLDALGQ